MKEPMKIQISEEEKKKLKEKAGTKSIVRK
jgi:hypothetical protein